MNKKTKVFNFKKDGETLTMTYDEAAKYFGVKPAVVKYHYLKNIGLKGYSISLHGIERNRYNVYEDGKLIFYGTFKQISEKFYIPKGTIGCALRKGNKIYNRYKIERDERSVIA